MNKMASVALLGLIAFSALLIHQTNAQQSVDWWPMFHHDLNRTGTSTSLAPTTNSTLWNYTTGSVVRSSPAVAGGLVYVGSGNLSSPYAGNVYCLNATTGAFVWSYPAGVWMSSPAVVGGLVYVGSIDGYFYCLNATTGALVWNYWAGGSWWGSSPAVVGGLVYVGCDSGYVYCLNATSGLLVWSFPTGVDTGSSPAVVGGFVYVGGHDKNVYCLNATTGKLVWNYTTVDYVASSPAVVGGLVYVGSPDGYVYCLNASTGAFVWSYTTGSDVISSPAVAGGIVYVGSYDDKVYALNATTGKQLWNYTTGNAVYSSPAVSPAVSCGWEVFVGSLDGNVYCLDASTGTLIWKYTTGDAVYSSPAVANGTVFVGSNDHKVYAFGPASGGSASEVYDFTIRAFDNDVHKFVNVPITMDGVGTGVNTPFTFASLTGNHKFDVPMFDPLGNMFWAWGDGETTDSLAVSCSKAFFLNYSGIAYYKTRFRLIVPPPNPNPFPRDRLQPTNPPPGTYYYWDGTVVSVTAFAGNGYGFSYWLLDGSNGGNINPISVTMNTNHTLQAVFVPVGVGGTVVPVNKLALWAPLLASYVPYVGLASTTMIALVAAAICVKRVKRRKEKQ